MLPFVLKGRRGEPDLTQSDFSLLEGLSCRHKVSPLYAKVKEARKIGRKVRENKQAGNEVATYDTVHCSLLLTIDSIFY